MSFWDVAKSVGKGVVKGGRWAIEHRKDIADVAHTGADLISRVTAGKKHAPPAQEEMPIVDAETTQPADPLRSVEARLVMTERAVTGLREDTDRRLRELHQAILELKEAQRRSEAKADVRFKFLCIAGGIGLALLIILIVAI